MRRVIPKPFPTEPALLDACSVAHFIRAARTQSGMTIDAAALAMGISKGTLQALEVDPSTVSFATVLQVARELGVSLFAFPSEQQAQVRRMATRLRNAAQSEDPVST